MPVNTELEAENDCEDEDIDQTFRIFEFTDILSHVLVITFSLNEPVYIIEVKEKDKAAELLSDIYGHNIAIGELCLPGNYLKMVRSKKYFDKTVSNHRL